MHDMPPTKVMMLGRIQPPLRQGYLNPPRTSPTFPQNLLRQTMLGGLGATGRALSGLGMAPTPTPDQLAIPMVEATYDNVGKPFPGQSAGGTPPAAFGTPMADAGVVTAEPASWVHDVYHGGTQYKSAMLGYMSLSLISGVLSAIHGWKRDKTSIAAWGWFTLGSMFPVITPVVALSQGFAKPRRGRR